MDITLTNGESISIPMRDERDRGQEIIAAVKSKHNWVLVISQWSRLEKGSPEKLSEDEIAQRAKERNVHPEILRNGVEQRVIIDIFRKRNDGDSYLHVASVQMPFTNQDLEKGWIRVEGVSRILSVLKESSDGIDIGYV